MIPLFKCRDMKEAIDFYTGILDFSLKYPEHVSTEDWVVDLVNGDAELMLTILVGDARPGNVVNVRVENVDELFKKYKGRGLDTSNKEGSPVHQGPTDQSWGMREFYVTDVDGNTLRYGMPMPQAIE